MLQDDEVKIPVFRRAEELDHPSEGWPSLGVERGRKWRGVCVRISIYLTLLAMVVALLGVWAVVEEYRGFYVIRVLELAKFLGRQLSAPVFLLLLEGMIAYCVFSGKRVPLVLVVFGLTGAFGMPWAASENSGFISHLLFESSMGYDEFIIKLAVSIAVLITVVWLLEFRMLRGKGYDLVKMYADWKMTRNEKRIFGLISIFLSWIGILWFCDVI
ncbi:MAG: hypothetical protein EOP85_11210 [Verrucomicrobiaceae bacterium]|nr:MAG: hypothetical protein EOP85_11210 [Verrucomicrobiaceae bacterium]